MILRTAQERIWWRELVTATITSTGSFEPATLELVIEDYRKRLPENQPPPPKKASDV